jgi:PleD family two-component response regulator
MNMLANQANIEKTRSKPQILICDDDITFSSELVEVLTNCGYCASALLTLTSIRAAIVSPKLLLLDVCMPQPDGFEILQMLAAHERKEHFRIVMISGGDDSLLAAAGRFCESNGLAFVGTMRKPIVLRELCDLIEAAYD